ncbi:metal ABC transporter solute-binding protein, Zn/Mn family [Macrococcus carouselicus]|uniref:Metal ABC transporter substrate-binding protein n=1 Tax=Macrococcus carouselicus TaxID=69969 RepID=A0A9Q8FQV9_9STAP|nr:zinc ABC transporter substrate-binding protein [Macrococcus carouselicus]TDM04103.1 metal ABC transporter substrate-binding protein [Macrococcus carouselicus]
MKKLLLFTALLLLVAGCDKPSEKQLTVTTTNSILYDMTRQVAGDQATIKTIVPVGQDPHDYDVKPQDVAAIEQADLIIYNGLNLENGNGWFNQALDQAGRSPKDETVVAASKNVDTIKLEHGSEVDPHAWLSIKNGILYVDAIKDALIRQDPQHKQIYNKNAEIYKEKLVALNQKYEDKFSDIPAAQRQLITSEGAFKYFSRDYDIRHHYIWEINTEKQGTPGQMKQVIDYIRQHPVKHLFVETSVDRRSMNALSGETGKKIFGEVYTDSLGQDEKSNTYYKMMEHNITTIHDGMQ